MGSRRHLNIRGKSANLPAITERDWRDIDFGIEMGVDFYALSFVRDAACIFELQAYLKRHGSHAKVRSVVSCVHPVWTRSRPWTGWMLLNVALTLGSAAGAGQD
jgi:hypothetical protein